MYEQRDTAVPRKHRRDNWDVTKTKNTRRGFFSFNYRSIKFFVVMMVIFSRLLFDFSVLRYDILAPPVDFTSILSERHNTFAFLILSIYEYIHRLVGLLGI